MQFKKYFTLEEAHALLPNIKRLVQLVLSISTEYAILNGKQDRVGVRARKEGLQIEFHNYIKEIESHGCFYKGTGDNEGLVDFPALIDGEEVFLCWKSDEECISFYNSIEEGFAGREPIPDDFN